ncbi:MAG: VTT domain-containing protein [Deltaproteobacteria bacterium]|nr:VTT domain-containing protein [Deltaproteobacteria bacterium]
MNEFFMQLFRDFSADPLLQGIVAALATFILEDPTTVGCGLLVAQGVMSFQAAFLGLSLGIAGGDFGLYLLGRLAQPLAVSLGLVDLERLENAGSWLNRNLVWAVVVTRFVPGMRLPTYTTAGVLKVNPWKFLATAVAASLVWTFLLLHLTMQLQEKVLEHLGAWQWPLGLGLIGALAGGQWLLARRRRAASGAAPRPPAVSAFELWPPWLFYLPVGGYYLWLALRFRGLLLPTAANPAIYAGGWILESKSQILSLVPPAQAAWVAPHVVYQVPDPPPPPADLAEAAWAAARGAGLDLPLVAKPDIGQRGAGVRRLWSRGDLAAYLAAFPPGEGVILQKLVEMPQEAGILYFRRPGQAAGEIFSLTLKHFPTVTGDGVHSLRELIEADRRARLLTKVYFARHRARLDEVVPAGEEFPLVFAGNHCQGAVFEDGRRLITPALTARVDALARALPGFSFGRFDVRFADQEELQRGRGFVIVEINGASAEATHIWDARTRLAQAYGTLFRQFRVLFEIGAANRRAGHRPLGLAQAWRDLWAYRRKAKAYPPTE